MRKLALIALMSLASFGANSSERPNVKKPDTSITVAVIDTGIIGGHPALNEAMLPGYNFVRSNREPNGTGRSSDTAPILGKFTCRNGDGMSGDFLHGIQVAGVIAGNGQMGVRGANPNAKILPIKAVGRCGMNREDLIDAMRWAAGLEVAGVPQNPHPARVINISMVGGKAFCGSDLQQTIYELNEMGVFILAAAGQEYGKHIRGEPANCEHVISVGALDHHNQIAGYSAIDSRMTLYAPGGTIEKNIFGDTKLRGYVTASYNWSETNHGIKLNTSTKIVVGTSFASAHMAGLISIWLEDDPSLTHKKLLHLRPAYGQLVGNDQWKLSPTLSPWFDLASAQKPFSARY